MWHTIGHSRQKQYLEHALERGAISHAYLFSGPSKVGKRTLALEFAGKIFGMNGGAASAVSGAAAVDPAKNPDLLIYNTELEHTSIAAMRELAQKLSMKPYAGSHIVAIVDNFDAVSNEAANSILKNLEEPNATVVLILICSNSKALLPTIVSRCQVVNFGRVAGGDVASAFKTVDAKLVAAADGKIGELFDLQADKNLRASVAEDAAAFSALKIQQLPARILAIKKFAELETDELSQTYQRWLSQEHAAMVHGTPIAYKNVQLLLTGLEQLAQNANKKLSLEKIFMNIV